MAVNLQEGFLYLLALIHKQCLIVEAIRPLH